MQLTAICCTLAKLWVIVLWLKDVIVLLRRFLLLLLYLLDQSWAVESIFGLFFAKIDKLNIVWEFFSYWLIHSIVDRRLVCKIWCPDFFFSLDRQWFEELILLLLIWALLLVLHSYNCILFLLFIWWTYSINWHYLFKPLFWSLFYFLLVILSFSLICKWISFDLRAFSMEYVCLSNLLCCFYSFLMISFFFFDQLLPLVAKPSLFLHFIFIRVILLILELDITFQTVVYGPLNHFLLFSFLVFSNDSVVEILGSHLIKSIVKIILFPPQSIVFLIASSFNSSILPSQLFLLSLF